MFSFAGLETKSVIDLETHEMSKKFQLKEQHCPALLLYESNRIEVPQLEVSSLPPDHTYLDNG